MTAPRQVLRGTTYLVTRRCAQRQFLLKPSKTTNEVFLYVLAVAVDRRLDVADVLLADVVHADEAVVASTGDERQQGPVGATRRGFLDYREP